MHLMRTHDLVPTCAICRRELQPGEMHVEREGIKGCAWVVLDLYADGTGLARWGTFENGEKPRAVTGRPAMEYDLDACGEHSKGAVALA